MKKLILILLIVIVIGNFILLYPKISGNFLIVNEIDKNEKGFVTKVIDGDTVIINGESVRLLGIDSTERGEPCYKEAKTRLEGLVLNKEVLLERDVKDKDQYKRLLRYIFIENEEEKININLQLVVEGLAIARFYEDKKYKEEILEAEQTARSQKIGCKWKNL